MRLQIYFIFLAFSWQFNFLFAQEKISHFAISTGYIANKKHPGLLLQAEYQSSYLWDHVRTQGIVMLSEYGSGFIGWGIGWECYLTRQILIIPSFTPGIYWKGRGKDLGCPLEFRSALDLTYEMKNQIRIGIQILHVSNAHLSHKNPGFNAWSLCLSLPLK